MTRRGLLGCAALVVAGCRGGSTTATPTPTRAAPDAAALATAREGELRLLQSYDTAIASASARRRPTLQVARALHATHLSALGGSPPDVTVRGPLIHDLATVLAASARSLRQLATTAHSGKTAATLASVAASHAAAGQ
jgi:hypothetical protein